MDNNSLPPDLIEFAEIIKEYSNITDELQKSHLLLQQQVKQLTGEIQQKNIELSSMLEQISELKNYLANIIQFSPEGIVAIDVDYQIRAWNTSANMLEDFTGEKIISPEGKPILDVMKNNCQELANLLIKSLTENKKISKNELNIFDLNGKKRILSVSVSPVKKIDNQGTESLIGAVQIFNDNTAVKELELKALRQDRLTALGEMAAGVAHEIRNPLGGIELYVTGLMRKFNSESLEYTTCNKIIAATNRLNRIVSDMLTFTRNREPHLRPITSKNILNNSVDFASSEITKKNITVNIYIDKPDKKYLFDPDMLTQAFLNIIINSCQAMQDNGIINIKVKEKIIQQDNYVVFSFCDNGYGIADEIKDKLFNPFFTLRKEGSGLGLAIVHKIIQDHYGTISVRNNQPKGTIFDIAIPVKE